MEDITEWRKKVIEAVMRCGAEPFDKDNLFEKANKEVNEWYLKTLKEIHEGKGFLYEKVSL